MPNAAGIYNLSELEDRVFRLLKQIQQVINTATGVESSVVYPSQAFSTTDISQQINSSLVKLYNEIIVIAISYMRQYFEQVATPAVITIPVELVNLTDYVQELTIPAIPNVTFPAPVTFARIIQNAAIYDAAFVLASTRFMQITEQIQLGRDEWHKLLIDAATAAFKNAVYTSPAITTDSLGRYNLSGIEDRVFRLIKQIQERPVLVDGGVASQTFPSLSFSTIDVDNQINSSLTRLYNEIIVTVTNKIRLFVEDSPEHFVQTFYVSTKANLVGPYGFPFNMIFLRAMDWLPIGILQTVARPEDWLPMYKMEDQTDRQMSQSFYAPTWQYDAAGTGFILNDLITQDNPNGVRIKAATMPAMVLPSELVNPGDVIKEVQFPPLVGVVWPASQTFARLLQQLVVFDAAGVLIAARGIKAPDTFDMERQKWHDVLIQTIEAAFTNIVTVPTSVNVVSGRLIRSTFSGRSRRIRGLFSWGDGFGDS